MKKLLIVFIAFTMLLIPACSKSPAKETGKTEKVGEGVQLSIAAGNSMGSYYTIGQALTLALKKQMVELEVLETSGSPQNLSMILNDEADLAISMLDVATQSYESKDPVGENGMGSDLQVMMELYPNFVQIVTTEDTGIKTFQDLKYKRVGVGAEHSGIEWNAKLIFEAHEMSYKDCEVAMVEPKDAVTQILEGKLDAAFVTGGVPNDTINEIVKDKSKKLVLIPITGKARADLIKKYPYYKEDVIPVNTYGKNEEVDTVSVMNILFANKNLDKDLVNNMLTTIEARLTELQASLGTDEMVNMNNPEEVTDIPLHPGAKEFFDKRK